LRLVERPCEGHDSPSSSDHCSFFSVRYDSRPEWLKSAHRFAYRFSVWLASISFREG
jgi:hypothetical protein